MMMPSQVIPKISLRLTWHSLLMGKVKCFAAKPFSVCKAIQSSIISLKGTLHICLKKKGNFTSLLE